MISENYYVYENTLLTDRQIKYYTVEDFDYVYYNPFMFSVDGRRFVIINFEFTQAEILEDKGGILSSLVLIKDEIIIETLFNILDETNQ